MSGKNVFELYDLGDLLFIGFPLGVTALFVMIMWSCDDDDKKK